MKYFYTTTAWKNYLDLCPLTEVVYKRVQRTLFTTGDSTQSCQSFLKAVLNLINPKTD